VQTQLGRQPNRWCSSASGFPIPRFGQPRARAEDHHPALPTTHGSGSNKGEPWLIKTRARLLHPPTSLCLWLGNGTLVSAHCETARPGAKMPVRPRMQGCLSACPWSGAGAPRLKEQPGDGRPDCRSVTDGAIPQPGGGLPLLVRCRRQLKTRAKFYAGQVVAAILQTHRAGECSLPARSRHLVLATRCSRPPYASWRRSCGPGVDRPISWGTRPLGRHPVHGSRFAKREQERGLTAWQNGGCLHLSDRAGNG
jgi:hypothetical protein